MLRQHRIEQGALIGAHFEVDFASFVAWRDWGRPSAGAVDCFAAAVLMASDGGCLLGVMAAHTVNAGRIYFPCGTPDPSDVHNGCVDLAFSVARELEEETGLKISEFRAEAGWTLVIEPTQVAALKVLHAAENAEVLRARILGNLSRQRQPELSDIRIVRGLADLNDAMPSFVGSFLVQRWSGRPAS